MDAGILTFSERDDVAPEVITVGRRLADEAGLRVTTLILAGEGGPGLAVGTRARDAIACGADQVVVVAIQADALADPAALADLLAQIVRADPPSVVLLGATHLGVEATARLGQRLGVASITGCLALDWDPSGELVAQTRAHGGRFVAEQVLHSVPRIAAVQVNRFDPVYRWERVGEVRDLPLRPPATTLTVVAVHEAESNRVRLSDAEVIVAAGRGVRTREDLALLSSLARALGGELAGTRPLVDLGWLTRDRLVGISGQTVKPRLYLACGVSGQIEHRAGMNRAGTVVAINLDPQAPIHQEADYSLVADLYEIVPALLAALTAATRATGRVGAGGLAGGDDGQLG